MTQHNHQTAPTQFVEANGIRFAYRRFGKPGGAPLVFNQHFRGTMDYWDPAVTDGLARNREVILFDNAGVSGSSGKVPTSIQEMGANAIAFIKALGLTKVDVLGFSIGGMVAQEITAQAPDLVRRLILVGTGPRGADMSASKSAEIFAGAYDPPEHLWLAVHFSPSPSSRAAGLAFLKRKLLRKDRDPEVSEDAATAQREAIGKYYRARRERSRLSERHPSADADRAGQQRRHRPYGELLPAAAESAERASWSCTRTQITDRSTSTRNSSCRTPTSSSRRPCKTTMRICSPLNGCRFPPSSRPHEFSWPRNPFRRRQQSLNGSGSTGAFG